MTLWVGQASKLLNNSPTETRLGLHLLQPHVLWLLLSSPCVPSVFEIGTEIWWWWSLFAFCLFWPISSECNKKKRVEEMIWISECGLERYLKFWLMLSFHLEISKSKQAYEVAVLLDLPSPTFSSLYTHITFCLFSNFPCGIQFDGPWLPAHSSKPLILMAHNNSLLILISFKDGLDAHGSVDYTCKLNF